MENSQKSPSALFDVYLRLRPNPNSTNCFLDVEAPSDGHSTHITIKPPENDFRKRAIEKFGFTRVFSEEATQLDVFNEASLLPMIDGVIGANGKVARDGLLATLGVTGSGKSHTILGSKSHRGLTQISLDVLFKSIGNHLTQPFQVAPQLHTADVAESSIVPATAFLESIYGDGDSRVTSRAATPMLVSDKIPKTHSTRSLFRALRGLHKSPRRKAEETTTSPKTIRPIRHEACVTRSDANPKSSPLKETANYTIYPSTPSGSKRHVPRVTLMPHQPSIRDLRVDIDEDAEYAIILSMYEVYNDRIFDLLANVTANAKNPANVRRRALLYKSTEFSPDRKVVAGLKKIVCGNMDEALLVLETGLTERRVAGTGSNAASSRSHGFFCVEVKKRRQSRPSSWTGSTMTIVDLAGSERARAAKTQGSTLAEAGKINESLMYLGQCMQMQSQQSHSHASLTSTDHPSTSNNTVNLVPFRQCKLTELLFSNYFPHASSSLASHPHPRHNNQQKAIMIVTADPRGDFNATSQILRYSALAREVTVPRIPSTTSTIITGSTAVGSGSRPNTAHSDHAPSPQQSTAGSSEEVTRLTEQLAVLQCQLEEETRRRQDAEDSWTRMEGKMEELEAEVRDECWSEFEKRLVTERARWATAWEEERERNEGHLDKKLDLAMRGVRIYEDEDGADEGTAGPDEQMEELRRENDVLRSRLEAIEREKMAMRTPSRKLKPLKARKWNLEGDEENASPFD